jgi:hypothetical protein
MSHAYASAANDNARCERRQAKAARLREREFFMQYAGKKI